MESHERPRTSIPGDDDVERQGLTEKPLPPATEATAGRGTGVHPAFFIVYVLLRFLTYRVLVYSRHTNGTFRSWIFFSNCTILLNKWLIDTAGFSKSSPSISLAILN